MNDELSRVNAEIQLLRTRYHDKVMPQLRALELRDEQRDSLLERLSQEIGDLKDKVDHLEGEVLTMVEEDRIAAKVAERVEQVQIEHRRHLLAYLTLPQKIVIYIGGTITVAVTAVASVVQLAQWID